MVRVGLWGPPSSDRDIVMPDKEECWQHALDFLIQPLRGEIRAPDTVARLNLEGQHLQYELAATMNIHSCIPFSIPPFHSIFRLETPPL